MGKVISMDKEENNMSNTVATTSNVPASGGTKKVIGPVKSGGKSKVTKGFQDKIDDYIRKNKEKNALEKELRALRSVIEPVMLADPSVALHGKDVIGRIVLQEESRAETNSRYTYYDAATLIADLPMETVKQCLVEVVDRELVEALEKLGLIPKETLEKAKRVKPFYKFCVK